MKMIASIAAAAAMLTVAAPASAQFAKPEDAVKYRQGALFVMGQHFSRIGAMVNGKAPYDAKAAAENAEVVANMARLPWAGFAPGTDKASTPNRAKPEVWTDAAKYKEHTDKFLAEVPKLVAATKANNLETLKPAFGAMANTCKGCHDAFRKDH